MVRSQVYFSNQWSFYFKACNWPVSNPYTKTAHGGVEAAELLKLMAEVLHRVLLVAHLCGLQPVL